MFKYFYAILILLFIFSPLGAMNLGWMFGRFEFINFLIILICINLAVRNQLIYLSVLLTIGTLIHEAFVFYAWPLLLATMVSKSRSYSFSSSIATFMLPVFAACYLLAFGNSAADDDFRRTARCLCFVQSCNAGARCCRVDRPGLSAEAGRRAGYVSADGARRGHGAFRAASVSQFLLTGDRPVVQPTGS